MTSPNNCSFSVISYYLWVMRTHFEYKALECYKEGLFNSTSNETCAKVVHFRMPSIIKTEYNLTCSGNNMCCGQLQIPWFNV